MMFGVDAVDEPVRFGLDGGWRFFGAFEVALTTSRIKELTGQLEVLTFQRRLDIFRTEVRGSDWSLEDRKAAPITQGHSGCHSPAGQFYVERCAHLDSMMFGPECDVKKGALASSRSLIQFCAHDPPRMNHPHPGHYSRCRSGELRVRIASHLRILL